MQKQIEHFCFEYVNNGFNGYKAYMASHPSCKSNYEDVCTMAYRCLRKPEVRELIESMCKEKYDALAVDGNKIITKLAEIAFTPKGDDYYSAQSQLKALEQLSKVYALDAKNNDNIIRVTIEKGDEDYGTDDDISG